MLSNLIILLFYLVARKKNYTFAPPIVANNFINWWQQLKFSTTIMVKEKRSYLFGRLMGTIGYRALNGIERVDIYERLAANYDEFKELIKEFQRSADAHVSRMAHEVGTSPLIKDRDNLNWFNAGWADQLERRRIGSMIAQQRKMLGLTQRQLAERAFITPANLANIELGRYAMGLDIFSRIVDALDQQLGFVDKQQGQQL